MGYLRFEKYKSRLNFDGLVLFPVFEKLMTEDRQFFNFIKNTYGDQLLAYAKSVGRNGTNEIFSKAPVVCGPKEKIEKFLAVFLVMLEDLQGKQYFIEDLNIVKDKNDINDDYSFVAYPQISVLHVHRSPNTQGNMESWRYSCMREALTTRVRLRRPTIVISEVPLSTHLHDDSMYMYVNLFSTNELNKIKAENEREQVNNNNTNNNNVNSNVTKVTPSIAKGGTVYD